MVPAGSPSRGGGIAVHKPTKLAHTFLYCSCVCFRLYGPFNCISFHTFSGQLSAFSICSSDPISALLVIQTKYLFMKASLSPDIILCVWQSLKHQRTNYTPSSHPKKKKSQVKASLSKNGISPNSNQTKPKKTNKRELHDHLWGYSPSQSWLWPLYRINSSPSRPSLYLIALRWLTAFKHSQTQSADPISCYRNSCRIRDVIAPLHRFPMATDRIVGPSLVTDRGLDASDWALRPTTLTCLSDEVVL